MMLLRSLVKSRAGSWNLRFDLLPAHGRVTIQLRDLEPQDEPPQPPTA
jgi:hypothetical protein